MKLKMTYILTTCLLFVGLFGWSQTNRYCFYDQVALEKYGDKKVEEAIIYLDSGIANCEKIANDAYTYHIRGFFNYELFKNLERDDENSSYRNAALVDLQKSLDLQPEGEYASKNRSKIQTIALTFQKNIADNLDTVNYTKIDGLNATFNKVVNDNKININLKQHNLDVKMLMADIHQQLFENNESRLAEKDVAIKLYKEIIAEDSLNATANENLGLFLHNLSIQAIMSLDDEADILEVLTAQEEAVELGKKAIPYLKTAYELQPKNGTVVKGLAAMFYLLNDHETHEIYMRKLENLSEGEKIEDGSQPNDN